MTTSTPVAAPRFTISEVLSITIAVTLRRFIAFFIPTALFGIVAVALIAALAALVFVGGTSTIEPGAGAGFAVIVILAVIVGYSLYFWLIGAVSYGVVQDLRGRRVGPFAMLRASLPRAPVLLGAGILTSIAIGIGSLLFIIPGIIVAIGLSVVAPVAAIERRGVFDSISRSWYLTRGYRWQIFGLFLLLYVMLFVVGLVAGFIGSAIGGAVGPDAGGFVRGLIELVLQAAYLVVMVAAAAVTYHTLRKVKEGVTDDDIAAVFD